MYNSNLKDTDCVCSLNQNVNIYKIECTLKSFAGFALVRWVPGARGPVLGVRVAGVTGGGGGYNLP